MESHPWRLDHRRVLVEVPSRLAALQVGNKRATAIATANQKVQSNFLDIKKPRWSSVPFAKKERAKRHLHFRCVDELELPRKVRSDRCEFLHTCEVLQILQRAIWGNFGCKLLALCDCSPTLNVHEMSKWTAWNFTHPSLAAPAACTMPIKLPFQTGSLTHVRL